AAGAVRGGKDANAARASGAAELPARPAECQRLHESFQADRRYLERMVALSEGARSTRVDAILELKGSIDASAARLQAQNAAMHRRAQELADREQRAYTELLSQGKNPHEVHRAKAVHAGAEHERRGIAQRIEGKQTELLGRLEVERVAQRRRKEQLDPTGKLVRVYPSQETTLKDHSFGLGHNLVHGGSNNNNRDTASPPGVGLASLTGPALPIPGRDLLEMNHKLAPAGSADILPPIHGGGGEQQGPTATTTSTSKKGFGKPKLSILEQQMLAKAREKQKEAGVFQKQVVWGKEFAGDAFLADPPVLWFRDFDVGTPLTLSFTLTNVSNTFNQFKLADMDEAIRELFAIAYTKPGRMSAGMSCTLRMSFTAIAAADLDAVLPVVAQTGAFRVPVKCTCKKAVPVLVQRELEFRDVVVGEKKALSVALENRGALPLHFRVARCLQGEDKQAEDSGLSVSEFQGPEVDDAAAVDANVDAPIDRGESFSDDERAILDHARALTVFKPEGSETPLRHTNSGVVAPYSSAPITFTFAPAASSSLEMHTFSVAFAQDGDSSHVRPAAAAASTFALPPRAISVSTAAAQVPVFTAISVLNLGCCVYEKLYRDQLLVCNRGKVALRVQLRAPKVLESCVEFTPSMGYVQAASVRASVPSSASSLTAPAVVGNASAGAEPGVGTFVVQVKFRPRAGMWRRLERRGFGREALGFLAVPVQVVVPDQVVPVFFILAARVTPAGLRFSMDTVDFGSCALGHSVFQRLVIESTSRLPQHFGFVRLPPEVKVDDSSGGVGATLLPYETKVLTLAYRPTAAVPFKGKLCVRTSLNHEYSLRCAGSCFAAPLVFSHSYVRLGASQVGQSQTFSLLCTNTSENAQSLELLPPTGAHAFLRLTPLVSRIEPGASIRIEIVFAPSDLIFDSVGSDTVLEHGAGAAIERDETQRSVDPHALVEATSSTTTPVGGLRRHPSLQARLSISADPMWRDGLASEERSVHHKWTVLCFRRDEPSLARNGASGLLFSSIQIETTAVEAKVFATPARLDYSQVAIGQSLVLNLAVTNASAVSDVTLRAKPLHVLGGFRVVNSLRTVRKSGGTHVIKLEFKPQSPIIYEDELELSSSIFGTLRVPLRGEGINPSLSFRPADGWLDFKDALARSRVALELVLANASAFPLTYSIAEWPAPTTARERAESGREFATNGLAAFSFSPREALIPAQGSLSVKVVFSPAMQRPEHYRQQFRINVPNESEMHVLTLSGRCWEDQLYIFSPSLLDLSPAAKPVRRDSKCGHSAAVLSAPPPTEDPFDLPPTMNLGALLSTNAVLGAGLRKPQPTIVLTFDSDDPESEAVADASGALLQQLVIGCTLPPSDDETQLQHAAPSGKVPPSTAAAGSATGSFEIAVMESAAHPEHTKLFALEPMKGMLTAGQQTRVQISFSPNQHQQHLPSYPGASAAVPVQKAGSVAGDADALRTVHLILRAKLKS
ncbi:hypothetical protein PybrP1_011177, partial [[Pythium] brassicae (nom. inval.)]